ncbi:MAG: hypothetical protein O3A46_07425 [Candidatus Poribacteria bacterium]|nr:hypothetical protein [Candidatus Poribacteria bacterium]
MSVAVNVMFVNEPAATVAVMPLEAVGGLFTLMMFSWITAVAVEASLVSVTVTISASDASKPAVG